MKDAREDGARSGDDLVEEIDLTPTSNRTATTRAAVPGEGHERTTQDRSGRVDTLRTAEINVERDRRDTLISPISALIAESMTDISELAAGRDPAAPRPEGNELTRRVGDSDRQPTPRERSRGYAVEVTGDPNARARTRSAHLIDQARALMESGALAGAVVAAEQALDEAERAAAPGIAEVIEPARALRAGLLDVRRLARRGSGHGQAHAGHLAPGPRRPPARVLAQVDGVRSLAQILDATRLHAPDGLRIAASLLRAGIIRVV